MFKKKALSLLGLSSVMLVLMLSVWVEQVQSQPKYPERAIDIICPYGAGGATDTNARIVADWLKRKWGVPINVINKPGGMTIPGNVEMYNAKPDGYTMMADCQSSSSMLEVSGVKLPFKVMDRTFVAFYLFSQSVFAVPSKTDMKNLKDLEAEIRRDPENFTWGSFGIGSSPDFEFRGFLKEIGWDISKTKPVAMKGAAEAVRLISGGHVKLAIASVVSFLPPIQAGTARALAMRGAGRHPFLPDVSTCIEQGYPYTGNLSLWWTGVSGPPNLPSHIVDAWNRALQEIFKEPAFVSKIKELGGVPTYVNSVDARKVVEKEIREAKELWGEK